MIKVLFVCHGRIRSENKALNFRALEGIFLDILTLV